MLVENIVSMELQSMACYICMLVQTATCIYKSLTVCEQTMNRSLSSKQKVVTNTV